MSRVQRRRSCWSPCVMARCNARCAAARSLRRRRAGYVAARPAGADRRVSAAARRRGRSELSASLREALSSLPAAIRWGDASFSGHAYSIASGAVALAGVATLPVPVKQPVSMAGFNVSCAGEPQRLSHARRRGSRKALAVGLPLLLQCSTAHCRCHLHARRKRRRSARRQEATPPFA